MGHSRMPHENRGLETARKFHAEHGGTSQKRPRGICYLCGRDVAVTPSGDAMPHKPLYHNDQIVYTYRGQYLKGYCLGSMKKVR